MLTARPRAVEFAPSSALSAAFVPRGAFMPTPMMSQSWNQYGAARSTTDLGSFRRTAAVALHYVHYQ